MKRVLIAEGSAGMRGWVRAALAPMWCSEVSSGWEVLDLLGDGEQPDVIVAGRWLPGMPGPQLLAALRTAGVQTPFALLAPLCRDAIKAVVARAGAAAVVEDPFDANHLRATVRGLTGGSRAPLDERHPLLTMMAAERIVANS